MSKLTKEKLIKRVKKLHKRNEFKRCLKTADKILKSYPEELDVYLIKIDTLINLEELDEIEETILKYLDNSPKEEEHYKLVTECLDVHEQNVGLKNTTVLDVIDEGLEKYPKSHNLIMLKARMLSDEFGSDGAIEYIDSFSKEHGSWKVLIIIK
jgi:tetratricopeptide (TPR) repeat protein